jgi:parvulin-like peptidyl-prolyl isomerase
MQNICETQLMKAIPRRAAVFVGALLGPTMCIATVRAQDAPAPETATPEATAPVEQPATPDQQAAAEPLPPIAATVNGDPIFTAEVETGIQMVQSTGRVRNVKPEDLSAEVLSQLIDRRLASRAIERDPTLFKEGEIEAQMQAMEANAQKQELTLAQVCQKSGISVETLRQAVIWQIAGPRYVERNLADDLEAFFKEHQQELDGTEIRASHIVLQPSRSNESKQEIQARAEKIRAEIESGKLDFAAAARKYSDGPSREQGGDIGYIPRHGVMLEEFGEALYSLKPGEISQPVTSALGTHLIMATGVNPGGKLWTQVVPQIKQAAAADKIKKLMNKERETAKIEFTGKVPYYKHGTKILATP